ncbi:site-specific integrase [Bradyrhizobium sp. JYMT SZCCT0428]|uniref:tyrosine-type recombinase/integrase n=1 Tax=Bradyrhizobium sp. JYMT SZCCT0428 TaxID=2807673 RepID=UPI001BA5988A|nr:site-specific integrase [Bradyrhizobium sp. JYMT SZCCT0428]MBR1154824.1 integrase arm-type DNA-binding domain-containing protein [Bradyrhizobium sp. JYMT SZCCT0428]
MARQTLTDRKVQSLKAALKGTRSQTMDALVPGFGVRVTDTGAKTYIFQARFPGAANQARREIAKVDAITLEAARDKARSWAVMIKQGLDPAYVEARAREEQAQRRADTFGSVMKDYFERKLARQRSGKAIKKRIENHLLPIFKDTPIAEITDLDILAKVVNPRVVKTPSQARQLFNDLGGFFSWAVDQRVYGLKLSPCATIKISKIVGKIVPRQRVLNDEELRAAWIAANRLPYPVGPYYRGLILTALRARELLNTDRSEWNLRTNSWEWTIPASRMKGKLHHVVPVTAVLHELVYEACPKRGRFLFSYSGGETPMRLSEDMKNQLNAEMIKVLREFAIERGEDHEAVVLAHFTNHDIRRTVRSRLSRIKGISVEVKEAMLAHVKPNIQRVYDVYEYFDEKREALELWAAKLREIARPPCQPPAYMPRLRDGALVTAWSEQPK